MSATEERDRRDGDPAVPFGSLLSHCVKFPSSLTRGQIDSSPRDVDPLTLFLKVDLKLVGPIFRLTVLSLILGPRSCCVITNYLVIFCLLFHTLLLMLLFFFFGPKVSLSFSLARPLARVYMLQRTRMQVNLESNFK